MPQVYHPIECPRCGNKRPAVKATKPWTRYYACSCGNEFKVPVAS